MQHHHKHLSISLLNIRLTFAESLLKGIILLGDFSFATNFFKNCRSLLDDPSTNSSAQSLLKGFSDFISKTLANGPSSENLSDILSALQTAKRVVPEYSQTWQLLIQSVCIPDHLLAVYENLSTRDHIQPLTALDIENVQRITHETIIRICVLDQPAEGIVFLFSFFKDIVSKTPENQQSEVFTHINRSAKTLSDHMVKKGQELKFYTAMGEAYPDYFQQLFTQRADTYVATLESEKTIAKKQVAAATLRNFLLNFSELVESITTDSPLKQTGNELTCIFYGKAVAALESILKTPADQNSSITQQFETLYASLQSKIQRPSQIKVPPVPIVYQPSPAPSTDRPSTGNSSKSARASSSAPTSRDISPQKSTPQTYSMDNSPKTTASTEEPHSKKPMVLLLEKVADPDTRKTLKDIIKLIRLGIIRDKLSVKKPLELSAQKHAINQMAARLLVLNEEQVSAIVGTLLKTLTHGKSINALLDAIQYSAPQNEPLCKVHFIATPNQLLAAIPKPIQA